MEQPESMNDMLRILGDMHCEWHTTALAIGLSFWAHASF